MSVTKAPRWFGVLLLGVLACTPGAQAKGTGPVQLDAALDTPVLLAGGPRRAFVRVALTGAELARSGRRTPVNLALVIDRSGSMQGRKLEEAKQAAIMAIERLDPEDVVSVVTYDDTVDVIARAGRIGDASALRARITQVQAGGSTALFAGVSMGAREARRFLAPDRVNRVILLSDGLANVGPSSPGELAELGSSLAREGIAVTTIGVGLDYNEDLMTRLAAASDGNHFFAERAEDLAQAYDAELGEVLSVLAQDVDVDVAFAEGVRPVRVLGREAVVRGQHVVGRLNQLYARQTKYFVVEVEVMAGRAGTTRALGDVSVTYHDLATRQTATLSGELSYRFAASQAVVDAARVPRVASTVARLIGAETNMTAMELRDRGKVDEAREMLLANAQYLEKTAALTDNRHLAKDALQNREAAKNLDATQWKKQRKLMSKEQQEQLRALGYVQ